MASLQNSAVNSEVITKQLAEIMININSGEGPLGRLIQDSTIAENINQTIANFKKSSEGLDETIEITKVNVFEFMEKLQLTVATTEIATVALGEIMVKINSGEGTLGMLIQDTTMAGNFNQTLINLEQSSRGLDENMEALRHNSFSEGISGTGQQEDARELKISEKVKVDEE
jgi:phospholipid/cholesterol/gamma-HCH transport system substrate-binding protein